MFLFLMGSVLEYLFIGKKWLNIFIGSSRLGEHLLFRASISVCVYRFMC